MSKTYSTPRKLRRERMVHQSTNLVRPKDGPLAGKVVMMGKGNTYKRTEPKPARPGRARRTRLYEERNGRQSVSE